MPVPRTIAPKPKPGYQWCTVCVMLVKGEANKGNNQGSDIDVTARLNDGDVLNVAVTLAIPLVFGPQPIGNGLINGVVPVCWDHACGVEMRDGVAPANPMEVAAFGHSNIPEIGRSR
jgi:hypothetical protein